MMHSMPFFLRSRRPSQQAELEKDSISHGYNGMEKKDPLLEI